MSASPRMRPVFAEPLRVAPERFFATLDRELRRPEGPCTGLVFHDGAIVRLRSGHERVWSPALHLHVDARDDRSRPDPSDSASAARGRGSTSGGDGATRYLLHGRFCPSSTVWTAFVAAYLALGCIAIASTCYGLAQFLSGQTPWGLLGVPAALALAGFTYGAAFIGQGLGAEDMYELRSFVDRLREARDA